MRGLAKSRLRQWAVTSLGGGGGGGRSAQYSSFRLDCTAARWSVEGTDNGPSLRCNLLAIQPGDIQSPWPRTSAVARSPFAAGILCGVYRVRCE